MGEGDSKNERRRKEQRPPWLRRQLQINCIQIVWSKEAPCSGKEAVSHDIVGVKYGHTNKHTHTHK